MIYTNIFNITEEEFEKKFEEKLEEENNLFIERYSKIKSKKDGLAVAANYIKEIKILENETEKYIMDHLEYPFFNLTQDDQVINLEIKFYLFLKKCFYIDDELKLKPIREKWINFINELYETKEIKKEIKQEIKQELSEEIKNIKNKLEGRYKNYKCDMCLMSELPTDESIISNILKNNPNIMYVVVDEMLYCIKNKKLENLGIAIDLKRFLKTNIEINYDDDITTIHLSNEEKNTLELYTGNAKTYTLMECMEDYNKEINDIEKDIANKIDEEGYDIINTDPIYEDKAYKVNIKSQVYEILMPEKAIKWRKKLDKEVKNANKIKGIVGLVWSVMNIGLFSYDTYKKLKKEKDLRGVQILKDQEDRKKELEDRKKPSPKKFLTTLDGYSSNNQKLCDKTSCNFIKANSKSGMTGSNIIEEIKQLNIPNELDTKTTPMCHLPNGTIIKSNCTGQYPEGIAVYSLSYHDFTIPRINEFLIKNPIGQETDSLKELLSVIEPIDERFKKSENGMIDFTEKEIAEINSVFIGNDKAIKIDGSQAECDRIQQIFNTMIKNNVGFYRAASLAVLHLTQPLWQKKQISIQSLDKSQYTGACAEAYGSYGSYKSDVYIDLKKQIKISSSISKMNDRTTDNSVTLLHELNHVFHKKAVNFIYDTNKFELLIESALATETIAYLYNLYPSLRDIESKAKRFIPTKEDLNNINLTINKINEAGFGRLINYIKSTDDMSEMYYEDLVKIVYLGHVVINKPWYKTANILTNTEEALTIIGTLPFLINGRLTIIKDDQNEWEFLKPYDDVPRTAHSDDEQSRYFKNKALLNILNQCKENMDKLNCNHYLIEVTNEYVEEVIIAIEDGNLPNLKNINLSGATNNSTLSLSVARNLNKIAKINGINVIFPKKIQQIIEVDNLIEIEKNAKIDKDKECTIDKEYMSKIKKNNDFCVIKNENNLNYIEKDINNDYLQQEIQEIQQIQQQNLKINNNFNLIIPLFILEDRCDLALYEILSEERSSTKPRKTTELTYETGFTLGYKEGRIISDFFMKGKFTNLQKINFNNNSAHAETNFKNIIMNSIIKAKEIGKLPNLQEIVIYDDIIPLELLKQIKVKIVIDKNKYQNSINEEFIEKIKNINDQLINEEKSVEQTQENSYDKSLQQ